VDSVTTMMQDAGTTVGITRVQPRSVDFQVAIVGAGPYGLSAAAHLKSRGIEVRVFGQPMEFWDRRMPTGMLLRSPRVASTISDPQSRFTLEAYEDATGTKANLRVHRETFVDYGKWFQNRAVGDLDCRSVDLIRKDAEIFSIVLSDGEVYHCKRVIVAAGVGPFKRIPAPFTQLSPPLVSHCYDGRDLRSVGRRVAVIGAGQSALESAALLREAGVEVEVIAKIPALRWIGMHKRLHQLGVVSKMLYSKHDIGPIGISRLVAYPNLLYHLPLQWKDPVRKRAVRPAGAPWLIPRLQEVKTSLGRSVIAAREVQDEVHLVLDDRSERRIDHVLLGTGYDVDISKYDFLSPELLSQIRLIGGYPEIGAGFESSVPRLHFLGAAAARKYGPLLYFVTGTEFASKELASFVSRD
jgi:FAD-dependent urate hydroxylase